MEIIIKEYNVYDFSELSEEAKEIAKQWYLDDDFRPSEFTEIYEQDLQNIFPDSELKLQYSLNYCQGDGLNIYGNLDVNNILNLPASGFCGNEFDDLIGYFTDKEVRTISRYSNECGTEIGLPMNNHYNYCCVDRISLAEEWENDLWWASYKNINKELLQNLEKYVITIIERLCADYEKYGYKFFYEVEDETMEELCDINEWKFLENGTYFAA